MGDGERGNGGARGGREEMGDGGEGTEEVCPIL